MSEPVNLWVKPSDLDPELVLEDIDPTDEVLLRDYAAALDACEAASQTLWALSGRKYHSGAVEAEQYAPGASTMFTGSYLPSRGLPVYDSVLNFYYIHPLDWSARKFRLNGQPIIEVTKVTDSKTGEDLEPTGFRVVNSMFLVITDPDIASIEVSYRYGQEPPTMGRLAAKALAQQFYYLWSGREDQCTLPDRVTSVNRQGVSWVLLDQQDFLDELKTGVYAVDLFLRQVNPDKARVKAKVFSVDIPRGNRRTL